MAKKGARKRKASDDQKGVLKKKDALESIVTQREEVDEDEVVDEEIFDAGKIVHRSDVGLLESALTPGIHGSMILWLNLIFGMLICLLLLALMMVGFSIHLCIMLLISIFLFVSVQWYV